MNVECSHCRTVFRVDPLKVPEGGVRARCSVCRGVFPIGVPSTVGGDGAGPEETAVSAAPAPPLAESPPAFFAPAAPAEQAEPEPEPETALTPATEAAAPEAGAAGPGVTEPARGAPLSPPPRPGGPPRFGAQDPQTKARRLARALVSDMVTYHPERRERGVRDGTLRQEFRDEIRKSWEEYVEQVGREMAHGTPFFRDALNEILAGGRSVF